MAKVHLATVLRLSLRSVRDVIWGWIQESQQLARELRPQIEPPSLKFEVLAGLPLVEQPGFHSRRSLHSNPFHRRVGCRATLDRHTQAIPHSLYLNPLLVGFCRLA